MEARPLDGKQGSAYTLINIAGKLDRPNLVFVLPECLNSSSSLLYQTDATIGSPDNPIVVRFHQNTGISENASIFKVYPNPASNTLFIKGGLANYSFAMVNSLGQTVVSGMANGNAEINFGGMAKGVYCLRLISGDQVCVEKVVIK